VGAGKIPHRITVGDGMFYFAGLWEMWNDPEAGPLRTCTIITCEPNVPRDVQQRLKEAAARNDVEACNEAVFQLYQLTESERAALKANGRSDAN